VVIVLLCELTSHRRSWISGFVKDGFNKVRNGEKKVVRVHVSSTGRRRSTSSRRKKRDERRMVKRVFDWEWRIENGGKGFSIENCERLRTENRERLSFTIENGGQGFTRRWRGKRESGMSFTIEFHWGERMESEIFLEGHFTLGLTLWILINSF